MRFGNSVRTVKVRAMFFGCLRVLYSTALTLRAIPGGNAIWKESPKTSSGFAAKRGRVSDRLFKRYISVRRSWSHTVPPLIPLAVVNCSLRARGGETFSKISVNGYENAMDSTFKEWSKEWTPFDGALTPE